MFAGRAVAALVATAVAVSAWWLGQGLGAGSVGSPSRTSAGGGAVASVGSGASSVGSGASTSDGDAAPPGPAYGTYAWPVEGPVIRAFDPPSTPYGSGHRGIDIAASMGTPVRAAQSGVVAFAGPVAGGLYVSIDHPDGVRTTYSWLSEVATTKGSSVERGQVVARSGPGHPGAAEPHLHLGARVGDTYIDPMLLLERGSLVGLVHLAPLD